MGTFFHDPEPPARKRNLITRSLESVAMKAIDWLWIGWIPKGYITIWAGETGAGKSTVLADVTARVTTGAAWPGEPPAVRRTPGRVLWLGSEDGMEEMTIPRLVACGAKLELVVEIQGVTQGGRRGTFSMQDDVIEVCDQLALAESAGTPFSMLVIDPITSYLPGRHLRKVDLNDAGQLRSILEPWLVVAQKFSIAIVCVTHFSKDTNRSMLHRVIGSSAFAQTCRSLCAVVARPTEGQYAKALIQVKTNLPEHPGGAWTFRTEKIQVGDDPVTWSAIHATRPIWESLDPALTTETLVGGSRGPISTNPANFSRWLKTYFGEENAEELKRVTDVKSAAIASNAATPRWWDDHSSQFLEKQNLSGTWWCRPKNTW